MYETISYSGFWYMNEFTFNRCVLHHVQVSATASLISGSRHVAGVAWNRPIGGICQ